MEIVKNPLVSIIIPVYNTKPYLGRCIQSVVHQTYKNLEILLIDDGSTDGSSGLCDRFEEQYANIHVVHLENSGVSAARNRGLDIAQGEFILFIDSDDSVSLNYVESFVRLIYDADLIIGVIEDIYIDENSFVYKQKIRNYFSKQSGFLQQEYYNLLELLRGPVIKLYKKKIIDKYHLRFDENLSVAEDQVFNFSYYCCIKSYVIEPKCIYRYYHRKNSNSLTLSVNKKTLEDEIFKLNMEYKFLKTYNINNYNAIYIYQLIGILNKYIKLQDASTIKSSYELVKKLANLNPLVVDKRLSFKRKIILYLLQYKMYWLIMIYYRFKSICEDIW